MINKCGGRDCKAEFTVNYAGGRTKYYIGARESGWVWNAKLRRWFCCDHTELGKLTREAYKAYRLNKEVGC